MIFLHLTGQPAIADAGKSLEQLYIQRLHHARPNEVRLLRDHLESIRAARLACRLQLREKRVPLSCYFTLAAEQAWHLRSRQAAAALLKEFDRRCGQAAGNLRLPPPAVPATPQSETKGVSPHCLRALAQAKRVQDYRDSPD